MKKNNFLKSMAIRAILASSKIEEHLKGKEISNNESTIEVHKNQQKMSLYQALKEGVVTEEVQKFVEDHYKILNKADLMANDPNFKKRAIKSMDKLYNEQEDSYNTEFTAYDLIHESRQNPTHLNYTPDSQTIKLNSYIINDVEHMINNAPAEYEHDFELQGLPEHYYPYAKQLTLKSGLISVEFDRQVDLAKNINSIMFLLNYKIMKTVNLSFKNHGMSNGNHIYIFNYDDMAEIK